MTALGDRGDLVCCSTQCPACHRIVLCDGVGARVDRIHHHDCTGPGRTSALMVTRFKPEHSRWELDRRIVARAWAAHGSRTDDVRRPGSYDPHTTRLYYGTGSKAWRRIRKEFVNHYVRDRWMVDVMATYFSPQELGLPEPMPF